MEVTRRGLFRGGIGAIGALALNGCGDEDEVVAEVRSGLAPIARHRAIEAQPPYTPLKLRRVQDALAQLHPPRPAPKAGEWLADHAESPQSFDEYIFSQPTTPTEQRRAIAVLPVGDLDKTATRMVSLTTEYLTAHFGLPVEQLEPAELPKVPSSAERDGPYGRQLKTGWLLRRVAEPALPDNAAALIAFLQDDLWPGAGWNYCFGEASLVDRVGVWSLARFGDPTESKAAFQLALGRTLKTAVHETGHMFSLPHCTRYHCVQSGINSLDESDRAPLWLCPDCLVKLSWCLSRDPREHLSQTAAFCKQHSFDDEHAFLTKELDLIQSGS